MNTAFGRTLAATIAAFAFAAASSAETLTYTLTPDFKRARLSVELVWETGERRDSGLRLAERFGPIDDVPALIRDVSFFETRSQREGNLWRLTHEPKATITCKYVVDPKKSGFDDWDLTHHPITTPTFFHGIGSTFLLTPASIGTTPETFEVILRWRLGAGHKAACSWGAGRSVGAQVNAADLRQSVYLAGAIQTAESRELAQPVTVALVDQFDFSAEEMLRFAVDAIRAQCEFMQESAFPEFVVTAIPVGEALREGDSRLVGSGLYRSFALMIAPQAKLNDAVQHLFAHELFHFWNGRMITAAEPERLTYWFVEGMTDYFALRILHESGLWTDAQYARWINRHLRDYAQNPGRNATNEEIERDYWTKRNTVGEAPYQRGLLLGLRWESLARKAGLPGAAVWMRELAASGRSSGARLTNASLRSSGARWFGPWFPGEFDRYVEQAQTVMPPEDALGAGFVAAYEAAYAYELGFDPLRSIERRRVHGLIAGSAADRAGLREGDELTAWRIPTSPEQEVRLTLRRGGSEQVIEYEPRGARSDVLQFRPR